MSEWVYVSYKKRSNVVKVGFTSVSPKQRRESYNRVRGMTLTHQKSFEVPDGMGRGFEAKAHNALAKYRIFSDREVFECSPERAIEAVSLIVGEYYRTPEYLNWAVEQKRKQDEIEAARRRDEAVWAAEQKKSEAKAYKEQIAEGERNIRACGVLLLSGFFIAVVVGAAFNGDWDGTPLHWLWIFAMCGIGWRWYATNRELKALRANPPDAQLEGDDTKE